MSRITLIGGLAALFIAVGARAHELDARHRYLANEGILVDAPAGAILFDAFFLESYGEYLLLAEETAAALHAGEPPYDRIEALFVSHAHGDHFSPQPTLAFLRARPEVRLVAPAQVVAKLMETAGSDGPALASRLTGIEMSPGDPARRLDIGGLHIEAVAIPHSGGEAMLDIHNLAFRVTVGDWPTVLHLGDAGTDPEPFERQAAFWRERASDTVFPPFWFYLDDNGRALLERFFGQAQVIGIHVPAEAVGQGDAWRSHMGGDLFTDPGETRAVPHPDHP